MRCITASYATHNSYAMHNSYAPHNQMKSNKFWVTNLVQQVLGTRVFDYAMQNFSQCYDIQFQTKIELVTNSKMARYWTVQQYDQRNDQHGLGLLDLYTVQQLDISAFMYLLNVDSTTIIHVINQPNCLNYIF